MVRFLAGITLFSGATSFLAGIAAIYAAPLVQRLVSAQTFAVLVGLMLIGGLINVVIGIGLWRYQNWARVIVIANSLIGLLLFIPELFLGKSTPLHLFVPIMSLVIVWYFAFNRKVIDAFRARSHSETNATLIAVAIFVALLANSYPVITKIWPSTSLSALRAPAPVTQPQ